MRSRIRFFNIRVIPRNVDSPNHSDAPWQNHQAMFTCRDYWRLKDFLLLIGVIIMLTASSVAADTGGMSPALPPIPKAIYGVNQYNVGLPADLAKYWPLSDADAAFLKNIGCNTIRFPLYPGEVGIDEKKLVLWGKGDRFGKDVTDLLIPDWRSLDAVMEWMIRHGFTPYVCPVVEVKDDWTTKAWMSLHVPEQAQRTKWYTELVVDHITKKYGENVIYGWYENWYWIADKREKSEQFPAAFRKTLAAMYKGRIDQLNTAWKSNYGSFDDVAIPVLMTDNHVPQEAFDNIRSFDLRRAMDLLQRNALLEIRNHIAKVAPKAVWAGGCMCSEFGGLNDIRSTIGPRTNATIRTCIATSDLAAVDLYSPKFLYYSYYRTLAKIAAVEGKSVLAVEAAATKPETFSWIADVGGPMTGILAWAGREDAFGFIKGDGTRREANANQFNRMSEMIRNDARYQKYQPGHVRVYFPEETYYYSVTASNHMDAYQHICDYMGPEELEPVLTDELASVPSGEPIYVLEKTIPLAAIQQLDLLGDRVVCLHNYFVDETGKRHPRKTVAADFYKTLLAIPDGRKLLDVFQRVEEKENNVAYAFRGTTISSPSILAEANQVILGRPNNLNNLIDGSIFDGATFANKPQDEIVRLVFKTPETIYGAFVQFHEGDGQQVEASRLPQRIVISVSLDGQSFSEVAQITAAQIALRSRTRFKSVQAKFVAFDFGKNTQNNGLKLEELGVLGVR